MDDSSNKRRKVPVIAVSVCLALWMMFIFFMSAGTADVSTEYSHSTGNTVYSMLLPGFDSLDDESMAAVVEAGDHFIRKCAHAAEFGILGGLFMLLMHFAGVSRRRGWWIAWICTAGYAVSDEIHQLFVSGRSCQFTDILIDSGGGLAGIIITVLLVYAASASGHH